MNLSWFCHINSTFSYVCKLNIFNDINIPLKKIHCMSTWKKPKKTPKILTLRILYYISIPLFLGYVLKILAWFLNYRVRDNTSTYNHKSASEVITTFCSIPTDTILIVKQSRMICNKQNSTLLWNYKLQNDLKISYFNRKLLLSRWEP